MYLFAQLENCRPCQRARECLVMKAAARWRPPSHHIGDYSKHKGSSGECDDHTTLYATLGEAVDTKSWMSNFSL